MLKKEVPKNSESSLDKFKRILRKYKYPSTKQEEATTLVLEQAETLSAEWEG